MTVACLGSVVVRVVRVHHAIGCEGTAVQMGLVEDTGFSTCSGGGLHAFARPLRVSEESGFQHRVQRKKGLDQLASRTWMEGLSRKKQFC